VRRQILQLTLALAACAKPSAEPGPAYTLDAGAEFVDVATQSGFHLNPDYPVSFRTADGERIDVKATMQVSPCVDDAEQSCSAHMPVPNKAGVLAFSVCSKDVCNIEKVKLSRR
jgi:hypothetical protein